MGKRSLRWLQSQLWRLPLAQAAQSALARRDMDQMSFAFACSSTGQTWDKAYMNRTVTDLDLYDVSIVTYPASPTTSVMAA